MTAALTPKTLFMRLALAWCLALLVTHLVNVGTGYLRLLDTQRVRLSYYLAKDLSILVPALEASNGKARATWLNKMQRIGYRYELAPPSSPSSPSSPAGKAPGERMRDTIAQVQQELGPGYPIGASGPTRLHLRLADGAVLTAELTPVDTPVSWWGGLIFLAQALAVALFTWFAVRQATQPLQRLAQAAQVLGTSMQCEPIPEDGPLEVARAAAAFNAMGRRIKEHLAERVRMLAAISHDLQTPITRMRLRFELLDNPPLRAKLESDLDAMQVLVEEGIAYARSSDRITEPRCAVDLGALLDAMRCDYADAGHMVELDGDLALVVHTRPHTLRRVVMNLTDNALKFAGEAQLHVAAAVNGGVAISVRDRGPGIAAEFMEKVFQPFYRLETSRHRSTGGAGLGLAIAQQLSGALGGTLTLARREGGGLEATLLLPPDASGCP